jgi:formylglycine-generating enzyme required for sulfatase activity
MPRVNLVRYHGILAPNAKGRDKVVPKKPGSYMGYCSEHFILLSSVGVQYDFGIRKSGGVAVKNDNSFGTLVFFLVVPGFIVSFQTGCDNLCSTSKDCSSGEVCMEGECQSSSGGWLPSDTGSGGDSDSDGDSDGDSGTGDPFTATWVSISGDTFEMGSAKGDFSELPVHKVTVLSFEIMKSEVTVSQYRECVNSDHCSEPESGGEWDNWNISGRENYPVNQVDWFQAQAFCEWAGGRLPTESEWEYAARSGGQVITYPWGEETPTCNYTVMDENGQGCGNGGTMRVCSKTAGNTAQGLCDMAGNVWEWVQDWPHPNYEGAPTDGSAWESPGDSADRMVRGGSWINGDPFRLRTTHRSMNYSDIPEYNIGFRCVNSSL